MTLNNIIVAYFIWNSWKSPERYGAGNDRNVMVASDATNPATLGSGAGASPSSRAFSQNKQKQHLSIEVHELKIVHVSGDGYEGFSEKKEESPLEALNLDRESQQDAEVVDIRSDSEWR